MDVVLIQNVVEQSIYKSRSNKDLLYLLSICLLNYTEIQLEIEIMGTTKFDTWGKSFLQDVFYIGGLLKGNAKLDTLYKTRVTALNLPVTLCKRLCDFIINRTYNFYDVSTAIIELAIQYNDLGGIPSNKDDALVSPYTRFPNYRYIKADSYEMASILANFCLDNKIYWDDVSKVDPNYTTLKINEWLANHPQDSRNFLYQEWEAWDVWLSAHGE